MFTWSFEMRHILRALINHARNLVLVENELHPARSSGQIRIHVGYIQDRAIHDAARLHQVLAPLPFQLFFRRLFPQFGPGNNSTYTQTGGNKNSKHLGVAQ